MRTILTREQYLAKLRDQGVPREHYAFICPACGTVQSIHDFVVAGVDPGKVENVIAFSCIGRATHRKAPPLLRDRGKQIGCDWTLGGLLAIHEWEVVDEEGKHHPFFAIASPELAQRHMKGCVQRTGEPCHWVEPGLCSACVGREPKSRNRKSHGQGDRHHG